MCIDWSEYIQPYLLHYVITDMAPYLLCVSYGLTTAPRAVWSTTTMEIIDAIKFDRMHAVTYLAGCRWQRLQDTGRPLGNAQPKGDKVL